MSLSTEIQRLNPSAIISLYELSNYDESGEVFCFTNIGNVVWGGRTYQALPCESQDWEFSSKGTLPRPKIRISNVGGLISILLNQYNDLIGAKLTRRRTLARYLMNSALSNEEFPPDIYTVSRKVSENKRVVEFELTSVLDMEENFLPRRVILSNFCSWQYRSSECSYTGGAVARVDDTPTSDLSQDACGKRLSSCKLRFGSAALPYGAFPGATRNQ